MHQEANNNIDSIINQINIADEKSAKVIATVLQNFMNSNVQIVSNNQNKDKLNKLYQEFGKIINSFDSIFYISKEELEILKSCVAKMKVFEDDFQDESDDGKIFYNNLFVLLLRIDVNLFVNKYETAPKYVQKVINNKYLYSCSLFEINRKEDAIEIIDEILSTNNEDKYFIEKCYFLFIDGKISELKKLLAKRPNKDDEKGFYGVFELEILFSKEKNIKALKKLNKKYKNRPLYHLRMAEIIFEIDSNNEEKIKENIKQAFKNISDDDSLLIMKLIDTAITVKQEDYLLKLVNNKKYSSLLIESRLLNLMVYKENKTEKEISKIREILNEIKNTNLVNIDNINAVLSLSCHKELEAIDYFNKSYQKNKTLYTASNLLNLVLKTNDARNIDNLQDYINTLSTSTKPNDYMLISSAYLLLGNSKLALENAYIGTIIAQNNIDYCMRFWAVHTKCEYENKVIKSVINDCVVEITNSKKNIVIALDKNISNKFNIISFYGVKFNNDKAFELNIMGKSVGDMITFNGENYKIKSITDKYDYFLKLIFPKINNGTYFKAITSDDSDDPLKGIREFLIEDKKNSDKHFEAYDLEKSGGHGLPLSSFVDNESKTYRSILLYLLFGNDDYKLYAGEINTLKGKKFVIDITSLVMLEQFELLNRISKISKNIYITQSTINTITKIFNYYLTNKKDTLSIFVDENNELRKQELSEDDYKQLQEFWRNILNVSSSFNVTNYESSLDKRNLESCQIDTLGYSAEKNCTLVSEDLLLKKVAYSLNNRVINSTNFLTIAEMLCSSAEEYINLVKTLSKGNYLYCIGELTFLKITLHSFLNKECQESVLEIIDNIFATRFLYFTYIEIVIRVILYIFYYENIEDKSFYIKLLEKIKLYSKKYDNSSCCDMLNKIKQKIENE